MARTSRRYGYRVYARAYTKPDSERIRLAEFLLVDSQGKLVAEISGDTTIGYVQCKSSRRQIVAAVKSFADYELARLGLKGSVSSENISLKSVADIEDIL